MRSKIALITFVMMLCSACSVLTGISSSYPTRWPPLSAAAIKDCLHLAGSYQDRGFYSYLPGQYANHLSYRLTTAEAIPSEGTSASDIIGEDIAPDGTVFRRAFRLVSPRFECKDGTLFLPPVVESYWDGAAGYRAQRRLALRKAENGDLIGEDSLFSIGHFLIFPVAGAQTFWYRWERVAK